MTNRRPALPATSVDLHAGRPLRLTQARGQRITVDAGIVWITVEGLADDVFLHAGDEFTIPGDGLTLVEAIASARVGIDTADAGVSLDAYRVAKNRGKTDLPAAGGIKSPVPFRLPTALSVRLPFLLRVPRWR